jgi:UDP-GlcNAc:undecaprenyl-phosphate GlcNAc-1-phosphate transferase
MVPRTHIAVFLLSLFVSALATPFIKIIANRFRLYDLPDSTGRKIHREAIPRIGGVAFFLGFYAPITGLLIYINTYSNFLLQDKGMIFMLYLGGFLTLAVGLLDDIKGIGAWKKLAGELAIASIVFLMGCRIDNIYIPFVGSFNLGILSYLVTVMWIVGIMNAFNLIDGLDGLASGVAFIAVCALFIMAMMDGQFIMGLFSASLAGAILGFLIYNFYPATIFMGDCGSLFLGFVLALSSIPTSYKKGTTVAMLIPIVILGLPIIDTILAIIRRILRGKSVFSGDREHIHHVLVSLGLSQKQAVYILYITCVLLAGLGLILKAADNFQTVIIVAILILVSIFLARLFRIPVKFREKKNYILQRKQASEIKDPLLALKKFIESFIHLSDLEIENMIRSFFSELGLQWIHIIYKIEGKEEVEIEYGTKPQGIRMVAQEIVIIPLKLKENTVGEIKYSLPISISIRNSTRYQVIVDLFLQYFAEYLQKEKSGN